MSSKTLYPPIIDSYMPAFRASNANLANDGLGKCKVYFSLSKFNANMNPSTDLYVHVSIVKHDTGMNVVKLEDDKNKGLYRRTGIILNKKVEAVENSSNLYSITILAEDLESKVYQVNGWVAGWLYKVQLRFSDIPYEGDGSNQEGWLNSNSDHFSEWSTVCILKAIGNIHYTISPFNISSKEGFKPNVIHSNYTFTTLQIFGGFDRSDDPSELIHSYNFILYDNDDNIIENTGDIYINKNEVNGDSFSYLFKTEFEDGKIYQLAFKYTTVNGYVDGFYKPNHRFKFECSNELIKEPPCRLLSVENDFDNLMENLTSLELEEDEGRVALKFYSPDNHHYSGNLCIRRSDSRNNFKVWEDVYIYPVKNLLINEIPVFYDYTIESGVFYLYGVQEIEVNSGIKDETIDIKKYSNYTRSKLNVMNYKIIRNFNYSFLLGQNNQQLKLMFDNTMTNFKYQVFDTKIDPINAKYSTITRNASTYYRTFPINGLISFWMDENKLFCSKQVIYKYEDVIDLYDQYNIDNDIVQYDYIYERDFRDKVLEFLQDGELKLFKSPTEGNIIVRLMEVNCIPNQSLDRMVYSFSAMAYEMADNTMENYYKYGFYTLNDLLTKFITYETRLGQIKGGFSSNTNILKSIVNKYDTSQKKDIKGLRVKVKDIHHMKITFEDQPLRIKNNRNVLTIGNNMQLNNKMITVYDPVRMYEFDDSIILHTTDTLKLLGPEPDDDGKIYVNGNLVGTPSTNATIDFLYDIELETYTGKRIKSRVAEKAMGQIFRECEPQDNIYNLIYCKYYLESNLNFVRLNRISFIEIEANPGTVFDIKDAEDAFPEQHTIGDTGILRLYDIENIVGLTYVGLQNKITGVVESKVADVVVNYGGVIIRGEYVEET